MLMPLSTPLTPPSQSPAGGDLEVGSATARSATALGGADGPPPIEAGDKTDTGNEARPDGGGEEPAGQRPRTPLFQSAGPTPYVAPPTVDAETVAQAISEAEERARFEVDDDQTQSDVQEAQARSYTETAPERAATEERIATIVPAPENGPSIRRDADDIRSAGPTPVEAE